MTNQDLGLDYIIRAKKRFKALEVLFIEEAYPDVIRESQEILELLLKGYLRVLKLDPPKWHDVSSILNENKNLLDIRIQNELVEISKLSLYLRKERENAFYGDDDLIPLASYGKEEAYENKEKIKKFVELFCLVVGIK